MGCFRRDAYAVNAMSDVRSTGRRSPFNKDRRAERSHIVPIVPGVNVMLEQEPRAASIFLLFP
jgi:hypothetical protein